MPNKKINITLIIVITSIISIAGYEFVSGIFEIKNFNNNLKQQKNITNGEKCAREEYSPRENFNGWKTYYNDDYCFSFQYPADWNILESLEHIGPYVAISDENISETDKYKITLSIKSDELFTSFLAEQSFLYNADINNFNFGSQPAFRLKGDVENSEHAAVLPYNYSDSILLTRTGKIDNNFVLQYTEKEYNENDRKIFEKIYRSLNIADK